MVSGRWSGSLSLNLHELPHTQPQCVFYVKLLAKRGEMPGLQLSSICDEQLRYCHVLCRELGGFLLTRLLWGVCEQDAVAAAGPLLVILGFIFLPLIWSVPEALITAELATAFPEDSGYVAWVTAAFGPFWGFQVPAPLQPHLYDIMLICMGV
jgi:hypothetical protein